MPHDITRKRLQPDPRRERESTNIGTAPKIRPAQIVSKANSEYDRVLAERLLLDSANYRRAVKAALRAYDKVLRDYDRKQL